MVSFTPLAIYPVPTLGPCLTVSFLVISACASRTAFKLLYRAGSILQTHGPELLTLKQSI